MGKYLVLTLIMISTCAEAQLVASANYVNFGGVILGQRKRKSITIKNALSEFEEGELDDAKQRINSLFGQMDPSVIDHETSDVVNEPVAEEIKQARGLISKAEGLFDTVSNEDKEDMIDLIESLTTCIDSNDISGLEEPVAELTDIIYYLEN